MTRLTCDVCPRHCTLVEGQTGACRARMAVGDAIVPSGYGRLTSIAIDPIEKKPIASWRPGTFVLSVGSYGCNLHCPWCQNHTISQVGADGVGWREVAPAELAQAAIAAHARDHSMIWVAYTYNEPLVAYEYVRDCCELVHAAGLANVLVTAGCVSERVARDLAPLVDATNIDLKAFDADTYRQIGGDLIAVRRTIEVMVACPSCHVEVTTLVVPGVNDTDDEIAAIARWLSTLDGDITLHLTRFFGAHRMRTTAPTRRQRLEELREVARQYLPHVLLGNV